VPYNADTVMAKKEKYKPSEAELEILQILWEQQPTTVKVIHEILSKKKEVGYTTVLKQMQRMYEDKKVLKRMKKGKTHLYEAIPKESEIQQGLFSKLVDTVFKGSSMDLVMHALGKTKTSEEELEVLQEWLDQQKKKKK
jgi:predicted transcriptional regulator